MRPTSEELAVITHLLSGDHSLLRELRRQVDDLLVYSREFTGAGFYTTFQDERAQEAERSDYPHLNIGFAVGDLPGLKHGIGFDLLVVGTAIYHLEGFTYQETGPDSLDGLKLEKTELGTKVLAEIEEYWSKYFSKS